jgi:hypothetical protein
LLAELAHRVERIHVDDDRARDQRAEKRDGIDERVGHHQRDAIAGLHADALQI